MGENSKFKENDTGDWYFLHDGEWEKMAKPSGGGSGGEGGSLPANFPAEGSANANKFVGFDENGNYDALEAPEGGGGLFEVTFSDIDLENGTVGTVDKTFAEISAAVASKKQVDAIVLLGQQEEFHAQLVAAIGNPASVFIFSIVANGTLITIVMASVAGSYSAQIIVDQIAVAQPLIVQLQEDAQTGMWTSSNTTNYYLFKAFDEGRTVFLNFDSDRETIYITLASALLDKNNNQYAFSARFNGSDIEWYGGGNDYVSLSLS